MVLTARLKPPTPGIIAARQGHIHFLPRKTSSAMLTESSPIRRPPPDIPRLDLPVESVLAPLPDLSPSFLCAPRCGPSLAGASVIDAQDLATGITAIGRRPRGLFLYYCYVPGYGVCGPTSAIPHLSACQLVSLREDILRIVSCDGFLCLVNWWTSTSDEFVGLLLGGASVWLPRSWMSGCQGLSYFWQSIPCGSSRLHLASVGKPALEAQVPQFSPCRLP